LKALKVERNDPTPLSPPSPRPFGPWGGGRKILAPWETNCVSPIILKGWSGAFSARTSPQTRKRSTAYILAQRGCFVNNFSRRPGPGPDLKTGGEGQGRSSMELLWRSSVLAVFLTGGGSNLPVVTGGGSSGRRPELSQHPPPALTIFQNPPILDSEHADRGRLPLRVEICKRKR